MQSSLDTTDSAFAACQVNSISLSLTTFIFGLLVAWTIHIIARAGILLRSNGWKPIYVLNVIQASMMMIKTVFAAMYAISDNLPCYPRGIMTSIPVSLANEMVYVILLLTLLVFTPFKRFCIAVFVATLSAHLGITIAGVLTAVRGRDSNNRCFDLYGPFFKHQYTLEGGLELFTLIMLFDALRRQTRGQAFLTRTESILNEIKTNAKLRVFLVQIVIAVKILHSWLANGGFTIGVYNSLTFTHGLDIVRAHVCLWSLKSLKKKLQAKAVSGNNNTVVTLKRKSSGKVPLLKMMSVIEFEPPAPPSSSCVSSLQSPPSNNRALAGSVSLG